MHITKSICHSFDKKISLRELFQMLQMQLYKTMKIMIQNFARQNKIANIARIEFDKNGRQVNKKCI